MSDKAAMASTVAIGPNGVYSQWLEVTPEVAEAFLKKNDINRRVKVNPLSRLVRQMQSGQYRLTHQGVAFDTDGRLADGQHRLKAIVETKRPQWLLVTWNLPTASREVIDTGTTRSTADNYRVAGYGKISNSVVATLNIAVGGRKSLCPNWVAANRLTPSQIRDLFDDWSQELEAVLPFSTHKACNSVAIAICIRAILSGQNRDRVLDFLQRLSDGQCRDDGDFGALRLRDAVISRALGTSGTAERKECYEKTTSALVAFLSRKPMHALRRNESEMFPVGLSKIPGSVWPVVEEKGE
jgi:hypothetical protein